MRFGGENEIGSEIGFYDFNIVLLIKNLNLRCIYFI